MSHKKMFVCLMFLAFLSVTITPSMTKYIAPESTTATLTVSPTTITAPPPNINGTFTVYINVENVTDLYSWGVGLSWNASILNCTSFTYNYSFFGPQANVIAMAGAINNTAGTMNPLYGASLTTVSGVTGSGTLAQVEFLAKAYGESSLNLTTDALLNSSGLAIAYNLVNGTFSLTAPEAQSPTINIVTQTPEAANVTSNEAVTVSANVTDNVAVQTVILSYSNDTGTTWYNVTMTNTGGDIWEGDIPGQLIGTDVQYKVIAYDTSDNSAVDNNAGEYYVYTVVPEFPTAMIVPMLIALLAVAALAKKIRPRN